MVEISPVLCFTKEEYELHGKYTILDHHTFKWKDGRMALALGLGTVPNFFLISCDRVSLSHDFASKGSLFNHSECPNVSYTLDPTTDSIRYTATSLIKPDEELCIFYGYNLWFVPVESTSESSPIDMGRGRDNHDGWGGLSMISIEEETFSDGNAEEIIPERNLPFSRIKFTPEEEEEEVMNAVRTSKYPTYSLMIHCF